MTTDKKLAKFIQLYEANPYRGVENMYDAGFALSEFVATIKSLKKTDSRRIKLKSLVGAY